MDYKNFWLSILRRLEPTISKSQFLTWFQNTAALTIENETLVVGVPTNFARDWIVQKYALKILQAAEEENSKIKEVEIEVDAALGDGIDPRTIDLRAVFAKPGDKKVYKARGHEEVILTRSGILSAKLNPRYTLANFVPGDENRLAHAAALSVARLPGQTYNPLVIYGGVGLGKTHLLSAIGHEVLTNDPNKIVAFTTSEIFTREFVAASKKFQADEFKKKFRDIDVLLFDDVQFLENRDKTQIELFNIFNDLHEKGKQLVFTSDRPPSELTEVMDRLRSRLTWGLVCEIEQPSFQSRLEILKSKTQERRAILDPDILEFIAMNVSDSVRSLESALAWSIAQTELLKIQPTVRELGKMLEKVNKKERVLGLPENSPEISVQTPAELIELVSKHFDLPIAEICGTSRKKEFQVARQITMYLAREILGCSLTEIAQNFQKDHSTVLHSVRKITADLQKDATLVRKINSVKKEMGL
ncbi:chromosomal replication initiator protein DnaA [Candidatus Gracilibacteria bacterium]|nr:chromosomal replication initiator protein DnaA [Candidatus Gracilibacteria bacterium]MCF7856430.1 chromosomal replication initiator protein DnaA [Candidatus Gracilibacteria bacterium]MCF7896575.1 chromosomal replication initiator protein DnaA [Candidatus Gracilibacteria bacterium]